MSNDEQNLGRIIKQQRVLSGLTLRQLSEMSGVSSSHLDRIERGERFPSAHTLRKIARPLGFSEGELFTYAGYLPSQPPSIVERASERQLDPYVTKLLSQEPVEIQRAVVAILTILKSIAKGSNCDIGFREYAYRKYPELDDDVITMIEDILEHLPKGQTASAF